MTIITIIVFSGGGDVIGVGGVVVVTCIMCVCACAHVLNIYYVYKEQNNKKYFKIDKPCI